MAEVVLGGRILGLGNSEIVKQHTIYHGVRFRDDHGHSHQIEKVLVGSSVNIVLNGALNNNERVEMWLCGPESAPVLYGIKTANDEAYDTLSIRSGLVTGGIGCLIFGVPLLIFFIGILVIFYAFVCFFRAAQYSARPEAEFRSTTRVINDIENGPAPAEAGVPATA